MKKIPKEKLIKNGIIDKQYVKVLDDLYDEIQSLEQVPNIIELSKFEKYFPILVPKDSLKRTIAEERKLIDLAKEFNETYDPYKPLQVVDRGEVILEIPPVFVQFKEMDEQYVSSVDAFNAVAKSDVPRYKAEAFQAMMANLLNSQLSDDNIKRLRLAKDDYKLSLQKFYNQLSGKESTTPEVLEDVSNSYDMDWEDDT
jgi:hypothetical protein